jgi:hypothetical protein
MHEAVESGDVAIIGAARSGCSLVFPERAVHFEYSTTKGVPGG